jgi:hypothetical protein
MLAHDTRPLGMAAVSVLLFATLSLCGCSSWDMWSIHPEVSSCTGGGDDDDDDGDGDGEEDGTEYALDEAYDETTSGVHLIAAYDEATDSFSGTAKNVTADVLCEVRIEVHLNNGMELGPSERQDLDPDQTITWELRVADAHKGEGEGEGEHDEGDEHD